MTLTLDTFVNNSYHPNHAANKRAPGMFMNRVLLLFSPGLNLEATLNPFMNNLNLLINSHTCQ